VGETPDGTTKETPDFARSLEALDLPQLQARVNRLRQRLDNPGNSRWNAFCCS
jgi:hypothetical protein